MKDLALRPIVSEKAYGLSQERNTYVFKVPKSANKHSIAKAVTAQFEVTVTKVRVSGLPGKNVRSVKRGGRSVKQFHSSAERKAYVTLKDGDSLPVFAAVEEASKPDPSTSSAPGRKK